MSYRSYTNVFIKAACAAMSLAALTATAQAQSLISLNFNSVVGGSGAFDPVPYNTGQFAAGYVFDAQSLTTMTEANQSPGDAAGGYWLGKQLDSQEFFVVDLSGSYNITSIQLFNTHNSFFNDRGTLAYEISASNSVVPLTSSETGAGGLNLSSAVSLGSGTLAYQTLANDPIEAELFTPNDTTSTFRYLRFSMLSTQSSNNASTQGGGLNEMKVFGVAASAAPEPGTIALLLTAGLPVVGVLRRRKPA